MKNYCDGDCESEVRREEGGVRVLRRKRLLGENETRDWDVKRGETRRRYRRRKGGSEATRL